MTTHPLLVLQLSGTQAEMGRQHGSLIARHGGHEATVEYYPTMPLRLLGSGGRPRPERMALRASRPVLEWALERIDRLRPAELRERTLAFARALGRPESDVRYFAVMDVFQNAVGLLARSGMMGAARRAAMAIPPACSSLVAWGAATTEGRLLHARNFDFPGIGIWEAQPVLAFCTPDRGLRYAFTTTRGADVPGVTAFNEAGITITAHTRFHRDVGFGRAIVDLGHEIVRRARTLDDAVRIAREERIASSWGLMVSSAAENRAVVIETTAHVVEATWPEPGEDFLATTNHYMHPALQVDEVVPDPAWLQHCFGRFAVLRGTAKAGNLDVAALQELLGSHRDPDTGGERAAGGVVAQSTSVQSIVADPEQQRLHLSIGSCPSGRNTFAAVDWQWGASPSATELEIEPGPLRDSRYAIGDTGRAYAHYVEACRLGEHRASGRVVEAELRKAVELDPVDPTWRFLAGCYGLRHGDAVRALADFSVGLAHEQAPFYRGQMLLWASRAAHEADKPGRAAALRRELLEMSHPLLSEHRAFAKAEGRKPPRKGKWRGIPVNLDLVTAG